MPARALPDFLGHLQRLSQEPARPVEERAGVFVAGLSAPALYHRQRNGLGALVLSDFQRRRRPAVSEQGSAEERRKAGGETRERSQAEQPERSAAVSRLRRQRLPADADGARRRARAPSGREARRYGPRDARWSRPPTDRPRCRPRPTASRRPAEAGRRGRPVTVPRRAEDANRTRPEIPRRRNRTSRDAPRPDPPQRIPPGP